MGCGEIEQLYDTGRINTLVPSKAGGHGMLGVAKVDEAIEPLVNAWVYR